MVTTITFRVRSSREKIAKKRPLLSSTEPDNLHIPLQRISEIANKK